MDCIKIITVNDDNKVEITYPNMHNNDKVIY